MAAPDRSVLEGKPVTELKEIAKSLDVKVSGLKKSEIIDAISNGKSKGASSSKSSAPSAPKPREKAPQAPVETTAAPSAQSSNGSPTEKPKPEPEKPAPAAADASADAVVRHPADVRLIDAALQAVELEAEDVDALGEAVGIPEADTFVVRVGLHLPAVQTGHRELTLGCEPSAVVAPRG